MSKKNRTTNKKTKKRQNVDHQKEKSQERIKPIKDRKAQRRTNKVKDQKQKDRRTCRLLKDKKWRKQVKSK